MKKIKVPFPLTADAYTISSNFFSSNRAIEKSIYNYTNRYSPSHEKAFPLVAKDDRMVLFGLSEYIKEHLANPITEEDIIESANFMQSAHSFGGSLPFPKDLWYRVLKEYNGFLPIKIEALAEGSTFFPQEPVIQVTSLAEGFGELCAHIEAVMVGTVSTATARVTMERHWLERIREWVRYNNENLTRDEVDAIARWIIHDFGMRASSVANESELLGMCHLLVFHGTDTFNAAYLAYKYGAKRPTGTSIIAGAHHTIQSHETEKEAFMALKNAAIASGQKIASFISDCYNFPEAVKILKEMAEEDLDFTFVSRPDSGEQIKNIIHIVNHNLKNLRFIEGNSVNPVKMNNIFKALADLGRDPTKYGIFGVGGYLRNTPTRDSLSSAYKLSSIGKENKPVIKLSEDEGKLSVPGPNSVLRFKDRARHTVEPSVVIGSNENSAYHTYYDGGKMGEIMEETFDVKQDRTINDFDSFENIKPIILSKEITAIQKEFYNKHRG